MGFIKNLTSNLSFLIYRKGDWKLIVGNHEAPFIFPQIFEEPSENGDWLIDNGQSFSGKLFEMFLQFTDLIIGIYILH